MYDTIIICYWSEISNSKDGLAHSLETQVLPAGPQQRAAFVIVNPRNSGYRDITKSNAHGDHSTPDNAS
jgi:hypothetical protein